MHRQPEPGNHTTCMESNILAPLRDWSYIFQICLPSILPHAINVRILNPQQHCHEFNGQILAQRWEPGDDANVCAFYYIIFLNAALSFHTRDLQQRRK